MSGTSFLNALETLPMNGKKDELTTEESLNISLLWSTTLYHGAKESTIKCAVIIDTLFPNSFTMRNEHFVVQRLS